jgi:hypothetical protein
LLDRSGESQVTTAGRASARGSQWLLDIGLPAEQEHRDDQSKDAHDKRGSRAQMMVRDENDPDDARDDPEGQQNPGACT